MKKIIFIICLCFTVSGCATMPVMPVASPSLTPEQKREEELLKYIEERQKARTMKQKAKTMADQELHSAIRYGEKTDTSIYRQELIRRNPLWSTDTKSEILYGLISLGMTEKQVLASRGNPSKRNRSVGSCGVHEQWVYREHSYFGDTYKYIYFENGILTSWQD